MKRHFTYLAILVMMGAGITSLSSCTETPDKTEEAAAESQSYTCPMHPQVVSNQPSTCPICGMDLVPFDKSSDAGFLTLSESQQALANISTDTVKTGNFSSEKNLNGRLVVDPTQTVYVSSRIAGRIEELYVRQTGEAIRKGQPLYRLYSEQLAALRQEYLLAVEQEKAFPQDKTFQQLAQAARQKLSLYGLSQQQIGQLGHDPYFTYYAPNNGVVSELFVTQGQYVSEGASVMSLEDYRSVWVEADLYPHEMGLVKLGDQVQVRVAGFENQPQKMRVEFIAPSLQETNQLIVLRGSISNWNGQLRPGVPVVVGIPVTNTTQAITLPIDAVIRDGRGAHIWLKTGDGEFTPKKVITGVQNLNRVEITEGLKPGDIVVVTGAYLLYSEYVLKKGSNPLAAHNH